MPIDLSLPFTNPVMIVALALTVFLVAPLLFERLGVPGMIGVIAAGAVIGPNALGLLDRDPTIVLLGTVGLLYLIFIAAIEIDIHGFYKNRNRSLGFGAATFLIPQTLGTAVGLLLGYALVPSILMASMFASHTLVSYPIASRLGISRSGAVTTAVGGTIVTDSAALLVLSVIASATLGEVTGAFWIRLLASLAVFVAVVVFVLPRLARWFFRNEQTGAGAEYVFVLAALFGSAFLAQAAGIEPILGAFLCGLALNRLIPENSPLNNRLHFFGNSFFIPFFLLSVGMLVDPRIFFGDPAALRVMIAMTLAVTLLKGTAAFVTKALFGYSRAEALVIFGLSVPQAAATLAATLVGYQIGLFDDAVLNGAILMIVVTCILGPYLVERYGRVIALQEERRPYEPADAPQRILIPISNPRTSDALLDLAFMIRDRASDQPLFPLIVVPELADETSAARIAEAEKMLRHAVIHVASVDVPVVPLTRVDHNFAEGIARAATETRSSTLVVGWDGRKTGPRRIFGSVLDQVLERTTQLAMVAKLGHPLNTTRRLVVVLPPRSHHAPGFLSAVRKVKVLAQRLGATMLVLVVGEDPGAHTGAFRRVFPRPPTTFSPVPGWSALLPRLAEELRPDDLVVVMSARRGTLPWHPQLERLPGALAELVPESFIMLYPSEARTLLHGGGGGEGVRRLLERSHAVRELASRSVEEAVGELLASAFPDEPERAERVSAALVRDQSEFPEITPGVLVPNAQIEGVVEPLLLMGISEKGLESEHAESPVRLVLLLLSPLELSQEHLTHLSEIARLAGDPRRLEAVLGDGLDGGRAPGGE